MCPVGSSPQSSPGRQQRRPLRQPRPLLRPSPRRHPVKDGEERIVSLPIKKQTKKHCKCGCLITRCQFTWSDSSVDTPDSWYLTEPSGEVVLPEVISEEEEETCKMCLRAGVTGFRFRLPDLIGLISRPSSASGVPRPASPSSCWCKIYPPS